MINASAINSENMEIIIYTGTMNSNEWNNPLWLNINFRNDDSTGIFLPIVDFDSSISGIKVNKIVRLRKSGKFEIFNMSIVSMDKRIEKAMCV